MALAEWAFGNPHAMYPEGCLLRLPLPLQCALLQGCTAREWVAVERTCRHYHRKFEDEDGGISLPSVVAKYACQRTQWARTLLQPVLAAQPLAEAEPRKTPEGAERDKEEEVPGIIGWKWMDWKDDYMLAVSQVRPGMRLPDGSVCTTPVADRRAEAKAAAAVQDINRDEDGRFVISAQDAIAAVLVALQARDQELLAAALQAGVPRDQGTEHASVAGTESLWLAIDCCPPNLPAVSTLLRHRTDPNKRLETGIGALHFAIYGGVDPTRAGAANPPLQRALTVQTLLAGRADPNVRGKPHAQWTQDVRCSEEEMVSALTAALDMKNWYAVAVLIGRGVKPSAGERMRMGPELLRALKISGGSG